MSSNNTWEGWGHLFKTVTRRHLRTVKCIKMDVSPNIIFSSCFRWKQAICYTGSLSKLIQEQNEDTKVCGILFFLQWGKNSVEIVFSQGSRSKGTGPGIPLGGLWAVTSERGVNASIGRQVKDLSFQSHFTSSSTLTAGLPASLPVRVITCSVSSC